VTLSLPLQRRHIINAVTADQSIHNRETHARLLEELLGRDLFRTKAGEPRNRFDWNEIHRELIGGDRPAAKKALLGLNKFVPYSSRDGLTRWNNYGVLGPGDDHIWTITQVSKSGRAHPPVGKVGHWLKHLLMRKSILPSYPNEDEFDSLLLDVDVEICGERKDLYLLTDAERILLFQPWVEAVARIQDAVGQFQVEWMLSGSKGFWLQVFFDEPGTREDAAKLRRAILYSLDPQIGMGRLPGPVVQRDNITYHIDKDNLGGSVCRIPWSLHQSTQNVSINIDPDTGQPDLFQFINAPPNQGSLSEFVSSLPPDFFPSFSVSIPTDSLVVAEPAADTLPPASSGVAEMFDEFEALSMSRLSDEQDPYIVFSGIGVSDSAPRGEEGPSAPVEQGLSPNKDNTQEEEDHICRDISDQSPEEENHTFRWDWTDVVREAANGSAITSWADLVVRDAQDGEKHERIVRSGNLLLAAAAMKGEQGCVDWEALIAEYEQAYAHADFSNGGTIRDWVKSLRQTYNDGESIRPFHPGLTKDEIEACRQLAQTIIDDLPTGRRPSAHELFQVLVCLCRLLKAPEQKEITQDFLARRSGLNPYPTWEKQKAMEFDENDGKYMTDGKPKHPRDYPSSVNARRKLARLLHLICDMDGQITGTKPFVRTKKGVPRWESETGKGQGSLFRQVENHPLWSITGTAGDASAQSSLSSAA